MNLPLPTGEVDFVSERSEFTKSGEGTIVKMINGTKRVCHAEVISASVGVETLKQVQGDNVFVQGNNLCVIARSETTKQSQHGMILKRLLRCARNDGAEGTLTLPTFKPFEKSLWGIMKKCAFTLSEVLIVLAVLSVIAAMTIPDLIQDYREKALITALKKNYSIFEQAVEMAQVDNGFMTGWDIGEKQSSAGALKLYNILKPYLRIERDCGTSTGCFADSYEALFNTNGSPWFYKGNHMAYGVLASGASFAVESGGTGCLVNSVCGYMEVDVNGKADPNKFGVDFFSFTIFNYSNVIGVTPSGRSSSGYCVYGDTGAFNGTSCTWWAIKHENMDYLRKAGQYTKY